MIEIKDGAAYRDGERFGTVEGETIIVTEKLHHQVVKKVEKETGLKVVVDGEADDGQQSPEDKPEQPLEAPKDDPEPPKDYRGDKTPAFINWMFRNHPEKAAKRYANRKFERNER